MLAKSRIKHIKRFSPFYWRRIQELSLRMWTQRNCFKHLVNHLSMYLRELHKIRIKTKNIMKRDGLESLTRTFVKWKKILIPNQVHQISYNVYWILSLKWHNIADSVVDQRTSYTIGMKDLLRILTYKSFIIK